MGAVDILRVLGSLGLLLGLLAAALWGVRRFNLRVPGAVGGGSARRLELVDRVALDPRRSVALLRRDGREHLLLIAPEGHVVIESGIRLDAADRRARHDSDLAAEAERQARAEAMAAAQAALAARAQTFARLLLRLFARARELMAQHSFTTLLDRAQAAPPARPVAAKRFRTRERPKRPRSAKAA